MTSGNGIAHAEHTPAVNTGRLNGAQLWVALPDQHRQQVGSFQHVDRVPLYERPGGLVQVFAGSLDSTISPATHFSDILGADVQVHPRTTLELPLHSDYEHAVIVLSGDSSINGESLQERVLYYLGTQRSSASFASNSGGRLLLIGGPPFPEKDSDVVELRGSHAARDRKRTERLGRAPPVRRCVRLRRAANGCPEPRSICGPESGQLAPRLARRCVSACMHAACVRPKRDHISAAQFSRDSENVGRPGN